MKMLYSAFRFSLAIPLIAGFAEANTYTYVPIPVAGNNIQTGLISTFPTGVFNANNALATPFNIAGNGNTNCGPGGSAACNFYDGFGFSGSGNSITLNVSVASPTDGYTLMNAYTPAATTLATVQFIGTGGVSETFDLVGGSDIRDFYQGEFVNTLTNGVAGVNALNAFSCVNPATCLGAGGTGNVNTGLSGDYVVDEQDYSLGTAFAGQTLTQIVITDVYNGSDPILLGVTVGDITPSSGIPEPSSVLLVGLAMPALGFCLARRRSRKA